MTARRPAELLIAALLVMSAAGCGGSHQQFLPGAKVNADLNAVFAMLMQRPDIDQATQQYQQLDTELQQALTQAIPALAPWGPGGDGSRASCGGDYPGIDFDGETRHLAIHVVTGNLPDPDYERALQIIGSVAQKYGFTPQPQRMRDVPGSHDAIFHNVHDEGEIFFGTALNTGIRVSLGCHLTPEAKKRGHPSATPTP